jgi:hypothetical protein
MLDAIQCGGNNASIRKLGPLRFLIKFHFPI